MLYQGILCIGDPHFASRVPGFRKDDYPNVVLHKVRWCLDYALDKMLLPVFLGDFFHWKKDNANWLIGALIEMFHSYPVILGIAGNHDCSENHLTEDDSLMILCKAGCLTLLDADHPWVGTINKRKVIVAGTIWSQPIPLSYSPDASIVVPNQPEDPALVIWITHHPIHYPGIEMDKTIKPTQLPGIDIIINGHIHKRQNVLVTGTTAWLNPGNISRINRGDASKAKIPGVLQLDIYPEQWEIKYIDIPCQPFDEVFYEELVAYEMEPLRSMFVQGLAELIERKTESGESLKMFIEQNLSQFHSDVAAEIHDLLDEVLKDESIKQ